MSAPSPCPSHRRTVFVSRTEIEMVQRNVTPMFYKFALSLAVLVLFAIPSTAQSRRKVIIDQDARGPATTDQQAILMFLQSANVETLGITVVSGDMWRDEEVAHTLRMLELTGHTDIPVVPGAIYPLINRLELIDRWEALYGKVQYQGAWNGHKPGMGMNSPWRGKYHTPDVVPDLIEGNPTLKPAAEDAAHFIIRMVHQYPHQVTIYAGGPLTNIAQAISIDPQVFALAVAGWLDPSIITKQSKYFMDIDISHTANYGSVLLWDEHDHPGLGEQQVNVPEELDKEKFVKMFFDLMALPSAAHSSSH